MIRHLSHGALVILSAILLTPTVTGEKQATEALFNLDSPAAGPFPSDWFTVSDETQNTGRRISLPQPDCTANVSDCEDLAVINELDGFNLQPRLSIPFSGPIDVTTVTSDTVFLVSLGSTLPEEDDMPRGTVVGIDQIVWDPSASTLHVESDALLAQHTRFALLVTRGVRDDTGARIRASDAFQQFRAIVREDYKQALLDAMQAARGVGVEEDDIRVASVFTTQSATAVLEKIRDQIHTAPAPAPADFRLGSNGERTVFSLNEIASITWRQQTRVSPAALVPVPVDLSLVRNIYPGAVGSVAFGKYVSDDYEVHPGEYIPTVGTRTGTPAVHGTSEIYFNLFLPSGPKPTNGWPVAIFGHAVNQNKNVQPLNFVSSMAHSGVAVIAINAVGHGFGPLGTLTISRTIGDPVTFPAGGRGIDQTSDGAIGSGEGISTAAPRSMLLTADGFRQTAADLMQLVRVIDVGLDVHDDGVADLDSSRISYFGLSLGGGYGTVFAAVEPKLPVAVFAVPAIPSVIGHLSIPQRMTLGAGLMSRQPSLLNSPGVTSLDDVAVAPPFFDDNVPLRLQTPRTVQLEDGTTRLIQSPVSNGVLGAIEIQGILDKLEWIGQVASAIAYAPHLRRLPLSGVSAKLVLYQIAKTDQSAPNPTTTALLRAGGLADRTVYYRHDLAYAENPLLIKNPHGFQNIPNFGAIALGAQAQTAAFLASDGAVVIHPEPARFFEVPIVGPLPEGLNFIR